MHDVVLHHRIQERIFEIRGRKVMLDRDLAELYGVETRALNQAVKRNLERFPDDFMFQLDAKELEKWRSQIVTSNPEHQAAQGALRSQSVTSNRGGARYLPYAFTEHGILMLSNVLKSERAVNVSIQIIRVFSRMREMVQGYRELIDRIHKIEHRQDAESREIWKAISLLQNTVMK